ncbi:MAG: hypothetical protein LBQ34_04460 [Alphaproteobacteria bacterium]|jgi:hypothetical protein|nr:hypothetical protein [Alphaproteobacteria bacterium]
MKKWFTDWSGTSFALFSLFVNYFLVLVFLLCTLFIFKILRIAGYNVWFQPFGKNTQFIITGLYICLTLYAAYLFTSLYATKAKKLLYFIFFIILHGTLYPIILLLATLVYFQFIDFYSYVLGIARQYH